MRRYHAAKKLGNSLVFKADLPAFAPIGRRYAEVEDALIDFAYSQEIIDYWTKYVDEVQQGTADAITGRRPWPEIVAEMSQKYPKEFPPSLDRLPSRILSHRVTPEGWKEYLEWLAQNARFFLQSKLVYAPQSGWRNPRYAEKVRSERVKLLPAGQYKFDCGHRAQPSENQNALFDRLETNQTDVFREVAGALREFYATYRSQCFDPTDPYEQVLFPVDDSGDVPLDRFRIEEFLLYPSADQIGLAFESLVDWSDEHGCALLVSNGKLVEGGSRDILFSFFDQCDDEGE